MKTASRSQIIAAEPNGHFVGLGLNDLRIRSAAVTSFICAVRNAVEYFDEVESAPNVRLEFEIQYHDFHQITCRHGDLPITIRVVSVRFGIVR